LPQISDIFFFKAIHEPSTLLETTNDWIKRYQKRFLFSQLKNGYEVASAFKVAREEALLAIKHIESKNEVLQSICSCIEDDIKEVHGALLDVQRLYNEIAASITTSLAARTVLNKQRRAICTLQKEGLLDLNEYKKLKGSVEYQMKKLAYHPPIINMPNKLDILRKIEWLECVERKHLPIIASSFEDAVFQRGDTLVKQGERSDNVFILARGTVTVSYESETTNEEVNVVELGMGSIFGEIAWVLNRERGATIRATSPGLIFSIKGSKLHEICDLNKELENSLWVTCGRRLFENALVSNGDQSASVSRQDIRDYINETEIQSVDSINTKVQFYNNGRIMLLKGTANLNVNNESKLFEAPNLLPATSTEYQNSLVFQVEFSTDAKFMCHKDLLSPSSTSIEDIAINKIASPDIVMEMMNTSQNILSDNLSTTSLVHLHHKSDIKLEEGVHLSAGAVPTDPSPGVEDKRGQHSSTTTGIFLIV
jgi:cAMP-binding proteins - catabolite gene activator and regulatory subunit of cAMP-dependent protein kinases